MLTIRNKSILHLLMESEIPMSVNELSSKLNTSKRTIQYDLRHIEVWAQKNNIIIENKSRNGLSVVNKDDLKKLLSDFESNQIKHYATAEERRDMIICDLLETDNYTKISQVQEKYQISKSSIMNDFDYIEEWLKHRSIKYERNKKDGFKLIITEREKRKYILKFIFANITKSNFIDFYFNSNYSVLDTRGNVNLKKYIGNIAYSLDTNYIKTLILVIEEQLNIKLTDIAFVSLMIHISLSIIRLRENNIIEILPDDYNEIIESNEFNIVKEVLSPLEIKYEIKFNDKEFAYLTLHLLSSQKLKLEENVDDALVDEIVGILNEEVFKEYRIEIKNDEELVKSIKIHLYPAILRSRNDIQIVNPIINTISDKYRRTFDLCLNVGKLIEKNIDVKLSENELSYFVIYIELALEKLKPKVETKKYNALVICNMGIGTSKILTTRLNKVFDEINIVEQCSYAVGKTRNLENVDMVISTIPITLNYNGPIIVVNPMLNDEDILKLNEYISSNKTNIKNNYLLNKVVEIVKNSCEITDSEKFYKEIKQLFKISEQKINTDFRFSELCKVEYISTNIDALNFEEALRLTAKPLVERAIISEKYVDEILRLKNDYNHHFMLGEHTTMPHADSSNGVSETALALSTLKNPVKIISNGMEKEIKVMIILCADYTNKHLRALAELTDVLEDEIGFIKKCSKSISSIELFETIKKEMEVNL